MTFSAPFPAGAAIAQTTGPTSATYNEAHPLLAYYYTWWDPENFSITLDRPAAIFNSDDPVGMRQDILNAQTAGIDGFVVSWLGNGNRTDRNLAALLDLGTGMGFRATIHFETPQFWDAGDVTAQLQAFYANRIGSPAMVTYQGRPVIFFWRAATYDNATWDLIRSQVDPDRRALWIADGDNFSILTGNAWDGVSPYAIAWSQNPVAQLPSWALKAQSAAPDKLFVPPVSPGCDDSVARAATCVQSRADGAYYLASLAGALAAQPVWATMVSTYNEWMEATEIAPSTRYGDTYLGMTRTFADVLHALGAPGADPSAPVSISADGA